MNGEGNGWLQRMMVRRLALTFATALSFGLHACGGGSAGQPSPPPPPFFTLSVTPAAPSVAPGTSSALQVSVIPQNGFNAAVSVTVSGLPSGLSAAPSSFTLQNTPQTLMLTAASSMTNGNYSFSLNGTSGSLNNSAMVNVAVGAIQTFAILQPTVLEVVTRFGSSGSLSLQTRVCCPPGPSDYLVNFSVQGLPAGVTANFEPNPISPGDSTTLTLTAPVGALWIQNLPIEVIAVPTASVPTQNLVLDLVVAPPPGNIPNNRSAYLRTDDTPQSIVYDAVHQLVFSSDFFLNRVDVVSPSTQQIVRSVPVLSPCGLALTLDGSAVLVGSDAQQITAISTTSLQVLQQWKLPRLPAPSFPPTYGPKNLYPLSNGAVAVHFTGLGGSLWQLALWNPTTNKISLVTVPFFDACFAAGSADGTKIIVADCSSSSPAVLYDAATNTFGPTVTFPGFINGVAASPDGSRFLIFDDTFGINIYNDQLQRIAPVPAAGDISGFIFSPDGTRIYVVGVYGVPLIVVSDGRTGAFINAAPALGTIPPHAVINPSPFVETPFAADFTGLIFGSSDHGIAFDDSSYSVNYVLGFNATPFFDKTVSPDFGPVNSATSVSFPQGQGFGFVPDVWFGSKRGTQVSLGQAGVLTVTAPPSAQPGPVSVKVIEPDGTPIFNPLAFSYGPFPMFVNGDTAAPAGGATSDLIGLGLPTDPTQIQVTVGNKSASIVSATTANPQGASFPFSYPFPAVDVKITLPSGSGDQDLQVTTAAGSATLSKAIHYVQSVTDYPSPDKFQAILLDRKRNQLYLSAGNHIDVFSLTSKQFLSPILPPALNGQKAFHGMALTPGGAELIAANYPDGSVALINPDQPGSATAVQVIAPGTFGNPGPENIATTNTGKAFIEPKSLQETGCGSSFYELDLSTLQVTTIINVNNVCIQPEGFPLAASGDGSKVLWTTTDISGPQQIALYDVASSTWSTNNAVLENFGGSAGVSASGSVFATGSGIVDASANLTGYLAYQEVFDFGLGFALPLEKIPDGGSLVYIPYPNFVDIFDVNHGALLRRVSLTQQVQQATDAMAIDPYGQNIYLITNAGLTAVQFGTAPLAIGSLTPAAGPTGTTVTIHGSGFQQATTVSANGSSLAATFVDPNTLQVIMPSTAPGGVQVTVTNPAGDSYSLDNAFTAQ